MRFSFSSGDAVVAAVVHRDRRSQGRHSGAARHAEHPLAGAAGQGRGPLLRQRRQLRQGLRVVQGTGEVVVAGVNRW